MQALAAPLRPYVGPVLAPDGRRIAVVIEGPSRDDVWVGDPQRDSWTPLTFEGDNRFPVWSPDGSRVAFQSLREGVPNVYWAPADGSGAATPLTRERSWYVNPRAFSPDGTLLALNVFRPGATAQDVWTVGTALGSRPTPLISTPAVESGGAFSPDGRWLAYTSDESGRNEVYVRSYPGGEKRFLVSRGGGLGPRWAARSREISYLSGNRIMTALVPAADRFDAVTPRLLFEVPGAVLQSLTGAISQRWGDVTPDGQRFLMVMCPDGPGPQIVVAPGFLAEARAKLRAAGWAGAGRR
jgi:Tol biopolymer transport system component